MSRDQYIISYNKTKRLLNWVSWKLETQDIGKDPRAKQFTTDTDLEKYLLKKGEKPAVAPDEYSQSCFDRGHQTPSKDRTDTQINNEATFNMSNIVPQTPYLNRVLWEHLEQYTRDNVTKKIKKLTSSQDLFMT